MIIDLNTFEQTIDPAILKRGLTYFKQGKVISVEHYADSEVCATIQGSDELYTTRLKIQGDNIVESCCSCPYDLGPVCKHVAALIFYLKQDELGIKVKAASNKRAKTPAQTKQEAFEKTLASVTKEQLSEYVEYLCSQNRTIRQEFLSRYQPQEAKNSKTHYKSSLSALSHSLTHRGFMDFHSANYFSDALDQTLGEADNRIEAGDYISAIGAACAVLEEATKAINHCDDSSGLIGSNIDYAKELLIRISLNADDAEVQKTLFDYCIKTFNKGSFKGWDWHLPLLEIAINVASKQMELQTISTLLETEIANSDDSGCYKDSAMEIKAKLIAKVDSDIAARAYMTDNINIVAFRKQLIKYNLQINNKSEAKRLAREGVQSHSDENQWREYLLKIAESENDKTEVVTQAKALLLATYRQDEMMNYITILKSWLNAIEWIELKLQLKNELNSASGVSQLLLLLAETEKDWELYFEQVSKSNHYSYILEAEKILPDEYRPQLAKLYADTILKEMSTQIGRNHYIEAARYIRRIIKLGERDMANRLIDHLRSTYRQRPALLEELDNI